jgi:endonuclease/exonuclease/phosphatase family metal-dependent hydrolase
MAKGDISFATFNLFNLNLAGKKLYDAAGWTDDQYRLKIGWTADMLSCVQPDVIGFQELWHGDCLEQAFTEAKLLDKYDLLVPDFADGKKIVCAAAVLKGLLVGTPEWVSSFPDKFKLQSSGDDPQTPAIAVNIKGFSRPVLHFQVQPRADKPAIHVYVCHLKSKAPTKVFQEDWYKNAKPTYSPHSSSIGSAMSTIRRTAEGTALRWMITLKTKNNRDPVVVLGDLNDGQLSNTLNIITAQPNYLKPFQSGGSDFGLYSAQALQQLQSLTDVYYTHVHQQARESLDHILVSEEFYNGSGDRIWVFDELTIENDHLNYEDHKERGTGDHGIVRVQFKYKPAH